MRDNPFSACLLLTGVLSAWALAVFLLVRFVLGLVGHWLWLESFDVSLVATIFAIAGAVAGGALVVINEHARTIVRSKRRI